MMLSREDDSSHTRLLTDACPLPTVELGRIENLRIFVSEAPLLVSIGVQRVVDEGVHLHFLPAQLVFRWRWQRTRLNLCQHILAADEQHGYQKVSHYFKFIGLMPQRY